MTGTLDEILGCLQENPDLELLFRWHPMTRSFGITGILSGKEIKLAEVMVDDRDAMMSAEKAVSLALSRIGGELKLK